MKLNDKLFGFTVVREERIDEISAKGYYLVHEKSGGELFYLDRDDRNMTFSIGFRTPPEDDTGVFHIIEHSVLCGSQKYPVKEPFVELLKGSLNTFLNAMTYEDRTIYPVASRCEKDFLNLTDIYLDAVFHPAMLKDERIFMQEGWHFEYENGELKRNGVVYNEMCGAYSSPEEIGGATLRRSLFPDTLYGRDSGGDPDSIGNLSYDQFVSAHKKYYHPSNSLLFLDGKMDLNKVLPLIASYLDEYDRREKIPDYPIHAPHLSPKVTVEFDGDSESGARVLLGYVSNITDRVQSYGASVITSALASTNESDLKRELLALGICEDMVFDSYKTNQMQLTVELIGVKEEVIDEAAETVERVISDIVKRGIDKKQLLSAISHSEFVLREADYGALPRGVAYAMSAYGDWICGEDVFMGFRYDDLLKSVREMASGDGFEKLLSALVLDSRHRATVVMLPSDSFTERKNKKRREELSRIKSQLTNHNLREIEEQSKSLTEWQNTPDSEENLNTVPTLSLSDISPLGDRVQSECAEYRCSKLLLHDIESNGIIYSSLTFFVDDFDEDDFFYIQLLSMLLTNVRTEGYSISELQSEIKLSLGNFSSGLRTFPYADGSGKGRVALSVSVSALKDNCDSILKILSEILLRSDFTDFAPISRVILQLKASIDDSLAQDALGFVLSAIGASTTEMGAVNDGATGFPSIGKIRSLAASAGDMSKALSEKFASLLSRICVRERLTLSLTGADAEFGERIVDIFPSGEVKESQKVNTTGKKELGLAVPSEVGYAALGGLSAPACEKNGIFRVVRSILSFDFLWNKIRIKGGAYGTGFVARRSGELMLYSYRDPSPYQSVKVYGECADYLRSLAKSGADITKFIVGAIGEYDRLMTPRTLSAQATYDILTGWSADKEKKLREDMLSTTLGDLEWAADVIENICRVGVTVIAHDKSSLKKANISEITEP